MDIVFVLLFIALASYIVFGIVENNHEHVSKGFLWSFLLLHFTITLVYCIYAGINNSDSVAYYKVSAAATEWLPLLLPGSAFIRFLAWPFTHFLELGYYGTMLFFSYMGFLGLLQLYLAAKENILLNERKYGLTAAEWVFLLPNVHFWSSSLGKGSVMLLGIGLFFYGLSRFNYRIFPIVVGALIIYFVRPHILFTCIGGVLIGLVFTRSGIDGFFKFLFIALAFIIIYNLTDKVLEYTDSDSINILNSSSISHKAQELSKSGSGIDVANYNPFTKLLTFWFRPLFFDAPGVLGIITSFENLLICIFFFTTIKYLLRNWGNYNGWFLICWFAFVLGSFALAQVSGNLGIAVRQKAQLMPLFFIVYLKSLSFQQQADLAYEN